MNPNGGPRKLTPEQHAELKARWWLWKSNCPKRLAKDFGISIASVDNYARDLHEKHYARKRARRAERASA